jgi:PIN domain nuclease of toxin-antitoxin system
MNLLFDTHTFLWWNSNPEKLSNQVLKLGKDKNNILHLSVASIWEIQIKIKIGKLTLTAPLDLIIEAHQQKHGIRLLPIEYSHVLTLGILPLHHKDPFDRMLVAQAQSERLTLMTRDPELKKYPINTIW